MKAVVPAELDGERADLVVARLGGLSRARAKAITEAGAVRVDGVTAVPRQRLAAGDTVEFEVPPAPEVLTPQDVDFAVAYEDEHLAVVEKPTGVVTHPGAGTRSPTLAAGVLQRWPQVRGVGDEGRWGIVHRLDKETSGLLVVALDPDAFDGLRSAIQARAVERSYLALVRGVPDPPTGTIDAPISRDPRARGRMRVEPGGRAARTHYRVVASGSSMALLEVGLDTGRTHQIRVHMAAVGMPIVGDRQYGRGAGSPRLFLHAARLAFDHPVTGVRIEVESPLPEDLATVLDGLGIGR
jgi:23S rRNA pseudouridine1911/1915/1917 synthase